MVRTRMLYVRLTARQHEQLKENCRTHGFENISSYVRHMVLDRDLATQQKIWEMHDHLLGDKRDKVRAKKRGDSQQHASA